MCKSCSRQLAIEASASRAASRGDRRRRHARQGEYRVAVGGVDVGSGYGRTGRLRARPLPRSDLRRRRRPPATLGERTVEPVLRPRRLLGTAPGSGRPAAAAGATIVARSAAVVTRLVAEWRQHAEGVALPSAGVAISSRGFAHRSAGARRRDRRRPRADGNTAPGACAASWPSACRSAISPASRRDGLPSSRCQPRRRHGRRRSAAPRSAPRSRSGSRRCGRFSALLLVPELEGRLMAAPAPRSTGRAASPRGPTMFRNDSARRDQRGRGTGRSQRSDPVALGVRCPRPPPPARFRVLASAGIALPVLATCELPARMSAITTTEVVGV